MTCLLQAHTVSCPVCTAASFGGEDATSGEVGETQSGPGDFSSDPNPAGSPRFQHASPLLATPRQPPPFGSASQGNALQEMPGMTRAGQC